MNKQLMTGAEVAVQACIDAKAQMAYGYPITPSTEVFTGWIKRGQPYLQTEDEIAAGFGVCGALLAGQKAFSVSAGPGHVLLQDAMSMAEGMRLPFVLIVGQRGGPSSGTVIYSQQEVMLACFGGNGEGLRFVYSPSSLSELYSMTRLAFNHAWKYRFPAIVLSDGYLLKTRGVVDVASQVSQFEVIPPRALVPEDSVVHWQNIYTFEEELHREVLAAKKDFDAVSSEVEMHETYQTEDADMLLIAHGSVAASVKGAVDALRTSGARVGLFRPMTLRPFPTHALNTLCGQLIKKIVVVESSAGQLARVVRDQLAPEIAIPFGYLQYPGLGIEPEEIVEKIKEMV